MQSINIEKFDMDLLKTHEHTKPPTILILGSWSSTREALTLDILHTRHNTPGVIVSENPYGFGMFKRPFSKFVNQTPGQLLNSSLLDNIVNWQNENISEIPSSSDTGAFLVLDDVLDVSEYTRDETLKLIFTNGRSWKYMLVVTMSDPNISSHSINSTFDYIFILWTHRMDHRLKIYESYASNLFPDFDKFCQVMEQCTVDYECLVINNKSTYHNHDIISTDNMNVAKDIFWYKPYEHEIKNKNIMRDHVNLDEFLKNKYIKTHQSFVQTHLLEEFVKSYMHPKRIMKLLELGYDIHDLDDIM